MDTCCKVGRGIARYGLDGYDAELAAAWTRERDPRSTRELARAFDVRLLRAAMREAGMDPLDGDAANYYRLLTDGEVTSGARTQARDRLAREGVPVETLESAFVSHQTIYRHLTDCLGARRERGRANPVDDTREATDALRNRLRAVTTERLDRLAGDSLAVTDPTVFVSVSVACESCGRQTPLADLLDSGGCACQADSSA